MYLNYWKLREEPFGSGLDERYLFMAPQHREGIARLTYAVQQRKAGALLTGPCGAGKSLVLKACLSSLGAAGKFAVALVENPLAEPARLLQDIHVQLSGRGAPSSSGVGFREIAGLLVERRSHGFHCLVVVEEAQLLGDSDRLAHLHLLMNAADSAGLSMLTMLLIGHADMLRSLSAFPGLLQRFASRWHVSPFTREQTRGYISHRLSIAGGNGWIIDDGASDALHDFSGGVARLINNAADMALYLGMAENAVRVDSRMVERVVADWRCGSVPLKEVTT